MKHVIINGKTFQLEGREIEKLLFSIHFFIQDISLDIIFRNTESWIHLDDIQMEGTVSQIVDIGLSFCFIKCRK